MNLTIRLLGSEVLHLSTDKAVASEAQPWRGDVTTMPLGFTTGDQHLNELETREC